MNAYEAPSPHHADRTNGDWLRSHSQFLKEVVPSIIWNQYVSSKSTQADAGVASGVSDAEESLSGIVLELLFEVAGQDDDGTGVGPAVAVEFTTSLKYGEGYGR
jgi:hypothetical protein